MASTKSKSVSLSPAQCQDAADCLRILAHPQRLALVQRLLQASCTVNELADACDLPQAMTSGHLRLMQRCGLLKLDRQGRNIFYSIAEPCLVDLMRCIQHRFSR